MVDRSDKILLFFIYFSVFMSAWVLFKQPAEIYSAYAVFFALLPVFIRRYGLPSNFWLFFAFFFFTGMINIVLGNNETDQFFKIFIGLMLSYLFYFFVMKRFDFDIHFIFRFYLYGAFIISVIGLVQVISYRVHFTPGYDFRWLPIFNKWAVIAGGNLGIRVNSIFGEPSQYAAVMAPAMFVSLNNLIRRNYFVYSRWQSILVLAVYMMTFSTLGYLGIFVALILMLINYGLVRYLLLFVPISIGAFFYLYNNVLDFRYRWDSTIRIFTEDKFTITDTHGSSIVLYNNYVVARENFKSNFLFGTGLGSHPAAFERYSVTKHIQVFGFANNSADANSMLLRIVSELGLIGVIVSLTFVRRNFVLRDPRDPTNTYWLISSATLCIIILYLLRQGHYFLNGFPIFVWMYYYNHKNYLASLEEKEEEEEEEEAETKEIDGEEFTDDGKEENPVPVY
ncbi:MAG: hypothetical protein FD123_4081 [Bacteroidetes bacterium]|nr:MAG: hypothetical protein FD123_4081 [Bacteroidota bacterium]